MGRHDGFLAGGAVGCGAMSLVHAEPTAQARAMALRWLLPFVLLATGLALLRPTVAGIDDVTWLIEVAERVLDGQRLYVDVIETNPPASVWLYLPAVFLARLLLATPETMVDAQTYLCATGSLWFCARIVGRTRLAETVNAPWLLASIAAILTILPHGVFGQKEHYVLMALLPLLAMQAARAFCAPPPRASVVLAGLCAGIGLAIKPHFALCLAPVLLAAAWPGGPWRSALPQALKKALRAEAVAAGAVVALYAALVVWLQPEFFTHVLPVMALVYVPVRLTWMQIVTHPAMLIWAAAMLALALAARARLLVAPLSLLALASTGAMLAFLLQSKGYMYQAYPMLALVLAGGASAVFDMLAGGQTPLRMLAPGALALVAQATWAWSGIVWDSRELRAVVTLVQPHPRLLAISSELSVGHPLVRQLGGTWVSRGPCLWNIRGGQERIDREALDGATLAQIRAYGRAERDMLLGDIRTGHPDIVLVQIKGVDWSKWAAADADISAELADFENRGTYDGVQVLQRR